MNVYALHGFLTQPSLWDFLGLKIHALDIYSIPGTTQNEWAKHFNATIPTKNDNILIGYSLGGRLALHALLDQPNL